MTGATEFTVFPRKGSIQLHGHLERHSEMDHIPVVAPFIESLQIDKKTFRQDTILKIARLFGQGFSQVPYGYSLPFLDGAEKKLHLLLQASQQGIRCEVKPQPFTPDLILSNSALPIQSTYQQRIREENQELVDQPQVSFSSLPLLTDFSFERESIVVVIAAGTTYEQIRIRLYTGRCFEVERERISQPSR